MTQTKTETKVTKWIAIPAKIYDDISRLIRHSNGNLGTELVDSSDLGDCRCWSVAFGEDFIVSVRVYVDEGKARVRLNLCDSNGESLLVDNMKELWGSYSFQYCSETYTVVWTRLNENFLDQLACPFCGNHEKLKIRCKALFTASDDGTSEEYEAVEYNMNSACICESCGYHADVAGFHIRDSKETKQENEFHAVKGAT